MRWLLAILVTALLALPTAPLAAPGAGDPVDLGEVVRTLAQEADGVRHVDPVALLAGALEEASAALPPLTWGLQGREAAPLLSVRVGKRVRQVSLTRRSTLPAAGMVLTRLRDFIRDALPPAYTGRPLNALLADGFVRGLDPHGALLSATAYGAFQSRAAGRLGGQGLVLGHRDGQLVVESVRPRSPAQRAGMRAGDRILRIGPRTALDLPLDEALALIAGPAGTRVRLLTLPAGAAAPRERLLERGRMRPASVEGRLIETGGGDHIAYLRVRSFQERTAAELRETLNRYRQGASGLLGLVLDLRDNHGGVLEQSIRVADLFLERGTIVTLSGARIAPEAVPARWYRSMTSAPLVVLVNGGTASAAEVLAGALKWNHRAVVIGEPTFGKDSIQSVFPLAGGHALKITVAHFRLADQPREATHRVVPHVVLRPVRFAAPPSTPRGLPATAFTAPEPEGEESLRELPYLVAADGAGFGGVAPEADYALQVATGLLQRNAPQGPTFLLRTALDWAQQERRRQDGAIERRLAAGGVDWSAGTGSPGGSAAIASTALSVRPHPDAPWAPLSEDAPLPLGASVRLTLTVRNTGPEPLNRLLVLGSAVPPWLDGLELPVGRLEAGQSARVSALLSPPADQPGGVEALHLRLQDGRGQVHDVTYVLLPLAPPPPGRLELSVQAVDDGRSGSRGNGDGRMQAGERIALRLTLRNTGRGPTGAGRIWLDGADGSRLHPVHTWQAFRSVPAGRRSAARLVVAAGEAPGFAPLALALEVMDDRRGPSLLRHRLSLAAGRPLPRITWRPPRLRLDTLPGVTEDREVTLQGRIVDDKALRDVRIYRNGHKVFYADAGGRSEWPLAQRLALEPGRNLIRIVARDRTGLVGVAEHVLWQGRAGRSADDTAGGGFFLPLRRWVERRPPGDGHSS